MRTLVSVCLGAALLFTGTQAMAADNEAIKQQISKIEKELGPVRKKAMAEPDVKAAAEQAKAAQEKLNATIEAAMERIDPKAKDLLAQKKKLQDEVAASKKGAAKAAKAAEPKPAAK